MLRSSRRVASARRLDALLAVNELRRLWREGRESGYLPSGNYLILYRVIDDRVEIVRYVHGRRDLCQHV